MKSDAAVIRLLSDPFLLKSHITGILDAHARRSAKDVDLNPDSKAASAVLFLLGRGNCRPASGDGPCLILNKRSTKVKQPGDLCCPGGGVDRRIDPVIARILFSPRSPLRRWPAWSHWYDPDHGASRKAALLLAASLREGVEEMRLNPFRFEYLGALPLQRLVLFKRKIYPFVGWVRQKRFYPNWEVADVVYIPLANLLDSGRYARYQLDIATASGQVPYEREFPCFIHRQDKRTEVLWGATFRITMVFLELVFGFEPPDPVGLPTLSGTLQESYFSGNGQDRQR